eukprot:TRINITY_DN15599_c0_g1_i16.p1 TRINITY_DN15599_c0_g1~~TRINITY_DN15599_c0_g1_i16.p1  ORF type:complete len:281 (+),score=55.01 TRINITY_DN15599_c0_g1_i16:53-895(+)
MASISEHLSEDLTGKIGEVIKKLAVDKDEESGVSEDYLKDIEEYQLKELTQSLTDLIGVKAQYAQDQAAVHELVNTTYKILTKEFTSSDMSKGISISNDKFKGSVTKLKEESLIYEIENDDVKAIVPSDLVASLNEKYSNSVKVLIVKWEKNPYYFIESAVNVSSALVGLSFVDSNNKVINLPSNQVIIHIPITLYIPLLNTVRPGNLECVYYDASDHKFSTEGCYITEIEDENAVVKVEHLTDFGIMSTPYKNSGSSSSNNFVITEPSVDLKASLLHKP